MKFRAILFSLALISLTTVSFSQIRKIPAEVTDAFKDKYPNASSVEWKDKLTVFVASFEDGGAKYEARFNKKGDWQSTEKEIEQDAVPSDVSDGLQKSKYTEWEVKSVYEISLPDNVTKYRFLVAKSDVQKKNLLFNSSGQLEKDNLTL